MKGARNEALAASWGRGGGRLGRDLKPLSLNATVPLLERLSSVWCLKGPLILLRHADGGWGDGSVKTVLLSLGSHLLVVFLMGAPAPFL